MNVPATVSGAEIMETVLIKGDLSRLTPSERNSYYFRLCQSVGLNPLTQPIEYIDLNGKLRLYAKKDCTDQLRSIHKVSVTDMTETERDGVYIVTSKVANAEGRTDIAKGAVNIKGLAGEALANAIMKAETKSKRRATLSICGLGILDETEVDDIPASQRRPVESDVPSPPAPSRAPVPALPSGPHALPRGGMGMKAWSDAYLGFIRSAQSIDELKAWDDANAGTLDAINEKEPSLYEIIDGTVAARVRELSLPVPSPKKRGAAAKPVSRETPQPAPPSDGDPEAFITWAKSLLQTAKNAEELDRIFNDQIETSGFSSILPPDQDEILGEHKRLRTKFEP